jgi:hypothetical protein
MSWKKLTASFGYKRNEFKTFHIGNYTPPLNKKKISKLLKINNKYHSDTRISWDFGI